MGQVLPSTQKWFDSTNDAMGMVTFATIVMMFSNNIWQLDFTPRTWVRWMIYLDALAFLVAYIGTCANDLMPECWKQNAYWLAADLLWSFKDAFKYGYICYKSLSICGHKVRWPCYVVVVISLLLYWLLCIQAYGFSMPGCPGQFKSQAPRVALYLYWTCVDIVASVMVVNKMRAVVANSKGANADSSVYYIIKFREELRLVVAAVGLCSVTILSVIHAVNPDFNALNIWRIVFVYIQLLMVMGSQKVVVGGGSSQNSQAASTASGARQDSTVANSKAIKD
ncbi:UNVERIFIED_CONTAM: hypothetical protein HDU68_009839 [Siphonaria sp. JEL0065]|nr:hypothetical protein HDU68_009839 [Siphonaria sp. JEL0065]